MNHLTFIYSSTASGKASVTDSWGNLHLIKRELLSVFMGVLLALCGVLRRRASFKLYINATLDIANIEASNGTIEEKSSPGEHDYVAVEVPTM